MNFKQHIIQDILEKIGYARYAEIRGLEEAELREEMQVLSEQALLSWYFAFLAMRSDLVEAGYDLRGFRRVEKEKVKKYLECPEFKIHEVMF